MDGYRTIETSRVRRPRVGLLIAMVVLGLVAGIALTVVAMRRMQAGPATTAVTGVASRTGGTDFTPAQPLGPGESTTPPPTDPALLASREATLAAQLTALEARAATVSVDAAAAGGQAERAEAMLIAVAVRRAIDHGTALGYLEEQLRARFGTVQPRAVAIVSQAARNPVTLEDLRQGLGAIGDDLATGRGDARWSDSLDRLFANLVILRKAGTPSPLSVDRLARARRLLDAGQVEAARLEVAQLPGVRSASAWLTAAHRYVVTRQALDAIDNTAILGQSTAIAPPPAPVAIVTDPGTAPATTAAVSPMAKP